MNVIGEVMTVVGSCDPSKVGVSGKVLLETANTLIIQSPGRSVMVEKDGAAFMLSSGEVVKGSDIAGRLQDRLGRVRP